VEKCALSADIRFCPKAVVPHSVHFRFWQAAVVKFGGCRKYVTELEMQRPECAIHGESLASLCTDHTEEAAALYASGTVGHGINDTPHSAHGGGRMKVRCTGKLDNGRLAGFLAP